MPPKNSETPDFYENEQMLNINFFEGKSKFYMVKIYFKKILFCFIVIFPIVIERFTALRYL